MATVSVRYIVDDLDAAIDFNTGVLGFSVVMRPAPTFAMLSSGDLRLLLSVGVGGDQILVDDPAGNCVELFEPHR
ncbi:MAG TPA: hypothetical protein VIQ60_08605 [Gemmatimonadaceae bacterium]